MDGQERAKELIDAAQNLSKEEKEKFKNDFEFMLDKFWEIHKETLDKRLEEKDIIISSLLDKLKHKDIEILNIEDICSIFNWEEQKARKFLKMAMQMKYATKIGKQTIITKLDLEKYLEFLKGKELTI